MRKRSCSSQARCSSARASSRAPTAPATIARAVGWTYSCCDRLTSSSRIARASSGFPQSAYTTAWPATPHTTAAPPLRFNTPSPPPLCHLAGVDPHRLGEPRAGARQPPPPPPPARHSVVGLGQLGAQLDGPPRGGPRLR